MKVFVKYDGKDSMPQEFQGQYEEWGFNANGQRYVYGVYDASDNEPLVMFYGPSEDAAEHNAMCYVNARVEDDNWQLVDPPEED